MSPKVLIILFSLIIVTKCQQKPNQIHNDLVSISNKLALDLLHTFPSDDNNFFSPLSITTALLMVMNGAEGLTNQEFRQLFHLNNETNVEPLNEDVKILLKAIPQKEDKKLILKLANRLLIANGFPLNQDYKHVMTQMFNSSVDSVDFKNNSKQIVKDINKWVSEKTNEKIKNIFNENDNLPEDTPMVLLNAVYFKGNWKYVFDRKDTQKEKFHNFGGLDKATMVDMMISNRNMNIKHSRKLGANIFEMPFNEGSDMSMLIFLPDELNGLDTMSKKLSLRTLNFIISRFGISKSKAGSPERLIFPKFKVEQEYDLKDHLKKLGINSVFEDSADLSGMVSNNSTNLKVSKAIHKAFIEVNEEGAEAAGVTKVVYALRSYRPNPAKVDRPFLFAIIDKKSSLIWFLGQIRRLS